jgi:hypothetical protein
MLLVRALMKVFKPTSINRLSHIFPNSKGRKRKLIIPGQMALTRAILMNPLLRARANELFNNFAIIKLQIEL